MAIRYRRNINCLPTASAASFDLKIVAVDSDGKAVPADRAHIDDIELVVD